MHEQVNHYPSKNCIWYWLHAYIHFTSIPEVICEVLLVKVNGLRFHLEWIEMPFSVHNSYTTAVRGECHATDSALLCYAAGHINRTASSLCIVDRPICQNIREACNIKVSVSTNSLKPHID